MARHPAAAVAAGIFASRLVGLLRVRAFSYYFGLQSDAADAFNAAFRIPNLLQNLFGEGALSGSFIPVYSGLRARRDGGGRADGARCSRCSVAVSVLSLAGVLGASWVIAGLAPGFTGPKRELTITLVRILFPGAGVLVLSAWCLGVLNVHGRFLLSYAAPIAWNVAMIATLLIFGHGRDLPALAACLAWGSVIGSLAQLGVQLRPGVDAGRRRVARADAAGARGRAQLRAGAREPRRGAAHGDIDTVIASLLPTGAVTGLTNTQMLYTLPVSLFGISISSAALPSIAADAQASDALERVRARVAGTRRASRTSRSRRRCASLRWATCWRRRCSRRGDSPRATHNMCGHPGGLGGRAGGGDDEPVVRRALRAGRYEDAAAPPSRGSRWRRGSATSRRSGCRAGSVSSRAGGGGADGVGGRRGWIELLLLRRSLRVASAKCRRRPLISRACGSPPVWPALPAARSGSCSRSPAAHRRRDSAAVVRGVVSRCQSCCRRPVRRS